MPSTVIVGTQFGDEGKGKVVDFLAEDFDIVARFQGGPNAGHTVVVGDKKFKLHHIPSGIIRGKECMLGNGMVIDPKKCLEEIKELEKSGIKIENLTISDRAHIITEKNIQEDSKDLKIGTTKRGVGPTYTAKVARTGLRFSEALNDYPELSKYVGDVSLKLNQALEQNKKVLFEGAQGAILDIDFGTYPYVTSSNTIAGGACTGTGVGPTKIDNVIGVAKAYTTRVGSGPFPTELKDEIGKHLLEKGNEYGTTTGRPRRCGWFDSVLVNHAVRISGIDKLAITKLDVLSGLDKIKICTYYELEGKKITEFPANLDTLSKCKPVYIELNGWQDSDFENLRKNPKSDFKDLPIPISSYIEKIAELCKTEVYLASFGQDRGDTLIKG